MRKVVIVAFFSCLVISVYAQEDLLDRLTRQAVEIDSLKRENTAEKEVQGKLKNAYQQVKDSLETLRSEFARLEELQKNRQLTDSLFMQKHDSIMLLQKSISDIKMQLSAEKQKIERLVQTEKEKGRLEVLAHTIDYYKSNSFDDLLKFSTKQSVRRDLQLVGDSEEVRLVLSDLEKCFAAEELLTSQYEADLIEKAEAQLADIDRTANRLDKLKERISQYQFFYEGFQEVLNKVVVLDNNEAVSGMGQEIQQQKLNKIISEVSRYIFNYDFNFSDYPYISEILREVLKRKQPNADAAITDLLDKQVN